jgi:hypothetical protein
VQTKAKAKEKGRNEMIKVKVAKVAKAMEKEKPIANGARKDLATNMAAKKKIKVQVRVAKAEMQPRMLELVFDAAKRVIWQRIVV